MKVEFSRKIRRNFLITVVLGLIAVGVVHLLVMSYLGIGMETVLLVSYAVQLGLSVISFFVISRISEKRSEQVGYSFLVLSMVKFLTYLFGFRLYFMQDDLVEKTEYAIYFVPYIVAFVVEIVYLVYVLNRVPIDIEKIIQYSDEEE